MTSKSVKYQKDGLSDFATEPMPYKGKPYRLVWLIDPDINDKVIVSLVHKLDGGEYTPDDEKPSGFKYFVNDGLCLNGKTYKLIWLLKDNEVFIGVVNCYRRD